MTAANLAPADILDELTWRGLIAQSTDLDELGKVLSELTTLYAGFDPTAPSLHAGHLVPLLTLKRFQRAGHRPIVLAGGATGLIGDPRDVGERTMQSAETVAESARRIKGQLERFVDFDDSPNGAIVVNNLDWTGKLTAVDFLRDLGKHFSGERDARPRDRSSPARIRRDELHRVQLHVVAGQRLPAAASGVRLRAAGRRIGSVGQHHRRRRPDTAGGRSRGARDDGAAGHLVGRQEVR